MKKKAAAYAGVFVIWYALYLLVNSSFIPSPVAVIVRFFETATTRMVRHFAFSALRVVTGLVAALVLGTAIGIICGTMKKADAFLAPFIYVLFPIPKAVFLPVFMVFFGLGEFPKILLIIVVIIFQFIISVRDAIRAIPPELMMYASSLRLSRINRLIHFTIPAAMPSIITALRINTGISTAVLFFSENFATQWGLGYYIMNSWVMGNYTDMFCGILAVSLLGTILFSMIDILERRLAPHLR